MPGKYTVAASTRTALLGCGHFLLTRHRQEAVPLQKTETNLSIQREAVQALGRLRLKSKIFKSCRYPEF